MWNLFQGTQERVRTSRGKRAISVRAIEVLLYVGYNLEEMFLQDIGFTSTGHTGGWACVTEKAFAL